jgi:hypothetical protein
MRGASQSEAGPSPRRKYPSPMARQELVQDRTPNPVHLSSGLSPVGAGRVNSLGCENWPGGRR